MLTDAMRNYVKNEKKVGYTKEVQNTYNYRLKNYTIQALKDLAFLAEKLPEEEQAKIFNRENVSPFLQKLFSLKSNDEEKRRERVIGLWKALFGIVGMTYALNLVSKEVWRVLASQPIPHIQALYYATLFSDKE